MPTYYTETGEKVRNPEEYALTGAPMYKTKYGDSKDINALAILDNGKALDISQLTTLITVKQLMLIEE